MERANVAGAVFLLIVFVYVNSRFLRVIQRYKAIRHIREEYMEEVKEQCGYNLEGKQVVAHWNYFHIKDGRYHITELFKWGDIGYLLVCYKRSETTKKIPVQIEITEMDESEAETFIKKKRENGWKRFKNFICKRDESSFD